MPDSKVKYTEPAVQRLEEMKMSYVEQIERLIRDNKYVPGDNLVEVTASDIEEAARHIRIVRRRKSEMAETFAYLYLVIGTLVTLAGFFFYDIQVMFTHPGPRGVLVLAGITLVLASFFFQRFIKNREKMIRESKPLESRISLRSNRIATKHAVLEAYNHTCCISGETALRVLDVAHILPLFRGGTDDVQNCIVLRTDLHRLFHEGWLTIGDDYRVKVSSKISSSEYRAYHDQLIRLPRDQSLVPARRFLAAHNELIFRDNVYDNEP